MRLIFLIALLTFNAIAGQAQTQAVKLDKVAKNDSVQKGQGVIYGNFIQRLGFSSGGFPQDIRLRNTETNEL
jgi:hypothetical protein